MKCVFVTPPVTDIERYGALAAAGSYAPPLGLCSLAAVTRQAGIDTALLDTTAERMNHAEAVARLAALKPDVVGITSTTSTFGSAARLAELIKQDRPGTTVLAGGVHVSALPAPSLSGHPAIDVGVLGEAEETILDLLDALSRGRDLGAVDGIAFRRDGAVHVTRPRPLIADLDRLPLPAWDLLNNFPAAYNVQAQSVAHFPSTSLCTSRGCTGKCTFCDRRIFGSHLRAHGADYVMRAITDLYRNFGVRDIQFEDDNFLLFRKRLLAFCDALRASGLDLTWSCQARVDMVTPDVLNRVREAGCWMILYGVESGSQKVLDAMGKGITVAKVEKAIEMTHEAGIFCKGFLITGFLNEDRDSLRETLDFVKRCRLDDISNHYYCPFPGSEAYEHVAEYGELRGTASDMTYYRPVFIPRALTEADLVRHVKACYRAFYLKPRILLQYLRRIRSPAALFRLARSGLALARYLLVGRDRRGGAPTNAPEACR